MKQLSIVVFLTFLLLYTSCQEVKHHEKENNTFLVTNPVRKDTIIYKDFVSQIRSIQHIELRALEKGYLEKIYVDEGQLVKKGQPMFQIMPLIYEAEMQKAKAEVNFTEIEYQNTKSLADSNVVSKNELALSKAKLDKATAELSLSQVHLNFTQLKAPFDGITGRFHDVRLGNLVGEGELLTTISDNSKMWVYFNVPEVEYLDYIMQIKSKDGLPYVKLKMANNRLFNHSGVIETIEADFNNETGNIAFRATFPNPDRILRHGETGNILMPVVLKNALLIPQKATFEILDKKYVFVVDKDNVVKSKEITIGEVMPHLYEITGGITENDIILTEGLRKVKNNQQINYKLVDPSLILSDLTHLHAE